MKYRIRIEQKPGEDKRYFPEVNRYSYWEPMMITSENVAFCVASYTKPEDAATFIDMKSTSGVVDYTVGVLDYPIKEKEIDFEQILKRKQMYYGNTQAAHDFAVEEYATRKMIEENVRILRIAEKKGDGEMEFEMHSRINELEKMIEN